ncbi:GNAT family N-acetyltransferase [Streptomyces monticola]|uniref:GNAT family N-acetyltransferase n=1 Tax=Streptomyces monticola TaxID=2666263 RepID=A0ABW2JJQ7_9ACTN
MPRLTVPDVRFRASFLEAMAEYAAEEESPGNTRSRELAEYGASWHEPAGFARYVAAVREEEREDGRRPSGFVPGSWFWYVDGDTFIGRIQVRHRLTPHLRDFGGHIGYGVRPSARRRGHATAMLRAVLPYARTLGVDPALVTCDTVNTASRKVIEACGGVLEDERDGKLRYWVPAGRIQSGS